MKKEKSKTKIQQGKLKIHFNIHYFIATIIIFLIEAIIAIFIHDQLIRPYLGDILVIILMYTAIKSIVRIREPSIFPILLFIFAVLVELSQLVGLVDLLELGESKIARVILGSVYDIKDIICYGIGSVFLVIWERKNFMTKKKH